MKKAKYPNRIKEIRTHHKLSREELAQLMGTIKGQIYKLESGERKLTHPWMLRLAKALNCDPSDFVSDIDDSKIGLICAIECVIYALVGKKLIKVDDLEDIMTNQAMIFQTNQQPNAKKVLNQLLKFLHSGFDEAKPLTFPQSQQPHRGLSKKEKILEN